MDAGSWRCTAWEARWCWLVLRRFAVAQCSKHFFRLEANLLPNIERWSTLETSSLIPTLLPEGEGINPLSPREMVQGEGTATN